VNSCLLIISVNDRSAVKPRRRTCKLSILNIRPVQSMTTVIRRSPSRIMICRLQPGAGGAFIRRDATLAKYDTHDNAPRGLREGLFACMYLDPLRPSPSPSATGRSLSHMAPFPYSLMFLVFTFNNSLTQLKYSIYPSKSSALPPGRNDYKISST